MLEANGTQLKLNCSWVHLDLGDDVAQPLLTLPGTACGPDLVSGPSGQGQREGRVHEQRPGLRVHQCKRQTLGGGGVRVTLPTEQRPAILAASVSPSVRAGLWPASACDAW